MQTLEADVYHPIPIGSLIDDMDGRSSPMPIACSDIREPPVLPTTAPWTASRASVHFSRAAYRLFSSFSLRRVLSVKPYYHGDIDYLLSIELEAHANLVYSPLDFALKNEADEKLFHFVDLNIELLHIFR